MDRMRAEPKPPPPDIFISMAELAGFLRDDPQSKDPDLESQGQALVEVFQDTSFKDSFPGYRDLKISILGKVARDISEGMPQLKTSVFGVYFADRKMFPFRSGKTQKVSGHIAFQIKSKINDQEVSQDQINAAIYCLSVVLSQIIEKES